MRTDLDRATEDATLNAALVENVAKLLFPGGRSTNYPDYVNDPAAVLELLHAAEADWRIDRNTVTGTREIYYACALGVARGFGPTFHRAAIRALLRAHGVAGIADRD